MVRLATYRALRPQRVEIEEGIGQEVAPGEEIEVVGRTHPGHRFMLALAPAQTL